MTEEATRQHYKLAISGSLPVEDVGSSFKQGFNHGAPARGELSDGSPARRLPKVDRNKYSD